MREKIKLESSAGDGDFYTTTKNKRKSAEPLVRSKYNKKLRKHIEYREKKIK